MNKQALPVVKDCTIDFFYYDQAVDTEIPGEVKFNGNYLVVSYVLEGVSPVIYQGTENGKRHYELRAPAVNGRATLHMFDKSKILEGYWFEEDENWGGMWRIRIK